ncbi:MAG: C-terminal binding protein [Defluviitaleaceae bacterium]|nr:C-terminal binding protein [Defluviitaleaceae bacterium]
MYLFGVLDDVGITIESEIIGEAGKVVAYGCNSELALPDDISKLDAAMVWHNMDVSQETIKKLSNCKALVRVGAGYDNVDWRYAGSIGIPVINIPDYGTNDVADHALALLLAVGRRITVYTEALTEDAENNWKPSLGTNIRRFTDRTMGIVGMGRIGTAMATRVKAMGMNAAFYDPYLPDGYDKTYQVKRVDTLQELFANSDYISIHAPATEETAGMIDRKIIENSKKGLTLINTARGSIVSLDAVYYGLKEGIIENFAADVLESEPPKADHPLINAYMHKEPWLNGRVVLTPHAGFYAVESEREMRVKAATQMLNAVQNIPLRNCINKTCLINPRSAVAD